jgi:hypothetical protein
MSGSRRVRVVMLTFRKWFEGFPLELVLTSALIAAALQLFDIVPNIF